MREDVREDYDEEELDDLENVTDRPARPLSSKSRRGRLTDDDKQWGMICHIAGVAGFIGPLICWMVKKDTSEYVDYHGKEALNFHLNILILILICMVTIVGAVVVPFVSVGSIIMSIMAGMKAQEGEYYKYPYIYRIIQ
jgi:uncharacterized Tic20 family protein